MTIDNTSRGRPMQTLEEALKIVLGSARKLETEEVELALAANRVLAEDVKSDIDMPPFDKSAMDGYACRRADLARELSITETIPAGYVPQEKIGANQCAKIMTGGPVPQGADCVVMVESTKLLTSSTVRFLGTQTRDNICLKGEDVRAGQVVLHKGMRIRSQHIAILAAVGCTSPRVSRLPRVAVISTGDELVTPDERPRPSQIRESNSHQLSAQARDVGAIVTDYGIVADRRQDIDWTLRKAMVENDVVVLSGGVSAGAYDYVPQIMTRMGIDLPIRKLAIKPGKPTLFGTCDEACCFGLPGNPVSSFVVFELLVRPFLYKLMGHDYRPAYSCVPLGTQVRRKKVDRQSWIPVVITEAFSAEPVEYHGSAHVGALCNADGLISIDAGVAEIGKGTTVRVRLI
jgi:molybdopterin molybdotransferase